MTLLYTDPRFLDHQTGQHPECSQRLIQVSNHLQSAGLDRQCVMPSWEPITTERLGRIHSLDYVESVRESCLSGGAQLNPDTVVSRDSYEVARLASGAVCDAVERVIDGEDSQALCLIRPPGHHALKLESMGFCLFNNIAIGARLAIEELDLDRVLIVDWDVHHGNGTQDTFWEDPQVGFFSIHRWPFYPGSGSAAETGTGEGLTTTRNLPIEMGISREQYRSIFTSELQQFANQIKPQLLLLSAGFDAHREDPVGSLGLETEDFIEMTDVLLGVADQHCQGRIVSVLEGGYNPARLAESVDVHLREMLSHSRRQGRAERPAEDAKPESDDSQS